MLSSRYKNEGKQLLLDIIVNGKLHIDEQEEHDNWNGGIDGHLLTFTVSSATYSQVISDRQSIQDTLREDIQAFVSIEHEYISGVVVDVDDSYDYHWRENTGALKASQDSPVLRQDAISRIWEAGKPRVFLSHKAQYKTETSDLKEALGDLGLSSFVAHRDIEPDEEWQREIEQALFSMDVLVALLSEDFSESAWTDQEVGIAYGRGVPVVTVRLGKDPYGFMGKRQALSGCDWSDSKAMALSIARVLIKKPAVRPALVTEFINRYRESNSWAMSANYVENLLSIISDPTTDEIDAILDAFSSNSQNYSSWRGVELLGNLLKKWTGDEWEVRDRKLVRWEDSDDL